MFMPNFYIQKCTTNAASRISVGELRFHEVIGSGAFAKVYKGNWKKNTVALKCINVSHDRDTSFLPFPNEMEALK